MKFQLTMTIAALAVGAKADWWRIDTICPWVGNCNSWPATWYVDNGGSYIFNGNEGCRSPGIPGIETFCIDWGNKRGHFIVSGFRRCVRETKDYDWNGTTDCGITGSCRRSEWYETGCTW